MNPRYLNYCRVHGKTPEQMHEHDDAAFPGGVACGFILWMSAQMRAFFAAHPEAFENDIHGRPSRHMLWDYAAWDRWLDSVPPSEVRP